ncbi:hypothetical protein [Streptacidiphilus sp. P02-A3a]|uniref:hypothetical protein n=1 Tax=Streptacidiphilus sp. P02-A3a TaxID=2704468 RepID=UPI0015FD84C2|nr:hypothetical protein [Streptacidiphilus sp. P02-A3a]QMU67003.1 hypothetical protein GXP74_01025 [Streptacidiphilus sp. P02-A3a]
MITGRPVRLGLLRRFWHAHRGAAWSPGPAVAGQSAPREPDRYQGPRRWQESLVVAGGVLLASGLFLGVFVGGLLLLASY